MCFGCLRVPGGTKVYWEVRSVLGVQKCAEVCAGGTEMCCGVQMSSGDQKSLLGVGGVTELCCIGQRGVLGGYEVC